MTYWRNLSALAAILAVAAVSLPSEAAKVQPQIKEKVVGSGPSAGFVTIGQIPASSEQLVILAESASVKLVRSASAVDISVSSNCPRNWSLKGQYIRQAGFSKPRNGVAMMADALGSRAIVNGKVYLFPPGPMKGLSMGKDGVTIGGQKVEPLASVNLPGNCGDGPDAIEIVVPESYAGALMLGIGNDSEASIDSWIGGKVEATIVGNATLFAGKLNLLDKAVLDVRGAGKAEIEDLSTKVLVANIAGSGKVTVKNGTAETSNATVAGDGTISLKGKFKNLQKSVDGQGSIQILN